MVSPPHSLKLLSTGDNWTMCARAVSVRSKSTNVLFIAYASQLLEDNFPRHGETENVASDRNRTLLLQLFFCHQMPTITLDIIGNEAREHWDAAAASIHLTFHRYISSVGNPQKLSLASAIGIPFLLLSAS